MNVKQFNRLITERDASSKKLEIMRIRVEKANQMLHIAECPNCRKVFDSYLLQKELANSEKLSIDVINKIMNKKEHN